MPQSAASTSLSFISLLDHHLRLTMSSGYTLTLGGIFNRIAIPIVWRRVIMIIVPMGWSLSGGV
jgi:hypothetical protein